MMYSNAKQSVPKVLQHIEHNQRARAALKAASVINFLEYRSLKHDMDRSLRPAAEKLLRWNTDKGAS